MVLVYPLIRFLAMVSTAPVPAPDAGGYRVAGDNFLNFSLTSLDGHAIRPWGVTIWMALWPGDRGIMFAQVALSMVAWARWRSPLPRASRTPWRAGSWPSSCCSSPAPLR